MSVKKIHWKNFEDSRKAEKKKKQTDTFFAVTFAFRAETFN
jgi:hypothetical protein